MALAVLLVGARAAKAQTPNDTEKAKVLFQDAMRHYNVGEFADAAAKFIEAYKAAPDPTFLYNAAQAYRLGGEHQKALFFYKSYLRDAPEAGNRAEVEKRIEQLKQIQEPPGDAKTPDPKVVPDPKDPKDPKLTTDPKDPKLNPQDPKDPKDPRLTPKDPKLNKTVPDHVVDETPPGGETDTGGGGGRPIYKKWWFWAGIGAVAAGTVAIVVVMSGDDGVSTELGDVGPGARASALGARF